MKRLLTYYIVLISLCFSGCYNDDSEVSMSSLEAAHKSSHMTSLIKSATFHQASFDDVIDGSSCFSLDFPYKVKVNLDVITIRSREDLLHLSEKDIVQIQYPVDLLFYNYTTHQVNSPSEFQNLQVQCDNTFRELSSLCVSFNYPIIVKDFNDINSSFDTHRFSSNKDFFLYLEHLHDSDMFEIQYPVIINDSITSTEVFSNQNLISVLQESANCM